MVVGLLMLTAIPTVTGMSLGISERSKPETLKKEKALMKKFTMTCWCEGRSRGKSAVHGGHVVLGEGKMWIQSRKVSPDRPMYPFNGFYLDYPDDDRPPPPPTGLVTMVSDSPPMMNWVYIDTATWEVKHGNRTESKRHWVGNFGWTSEDDDDFETDPGGLVYQGEEQFVAVEPKRGSREAAEGRWQVFWDRNDDKLQGVDGIEARLVLRISLERAFIEEEPVPRTDPAQEQRSGRQQNDGSANHSHQAQITQQHAGEKVLQGQHPEAVSQRKQAGE